MLKTAIIIGAGPAGLTAAYEFLKKGIKPIILETDQNYIGGLSRTENYKNNHIDIGGHRFFSKSDIVMNWWSQFMPAENETNNKPKMLIRQRLSRIFYLRNFFPYPVTLNWQTIKNLGFTKITRIGFSYLATKFSKKKENNLENFFTNRFGKELYQTFFKDYTEKVWGVACDKIPAEWGAQRIKKLSLSKAIFNAFASLFRKKDITQKNTETSLIEQFLYPPHGPGEFWTLVADKIKKEGGEILMGHTVTGIISENNQIQKITAINKNNEKISLTGDYYFSSMPVKDLIKSLDKAPEEIKNIADNLQYRDFLTVGLLVKNFSYKKQTITDNWIYVQEPDVKVGRIQIFNNWSQEMVADKNKIWIGLEYFVNEHDELWSKTQEEMIKFAGEEMEKLGLIKKDDILDATTVKVLKAYPAYFGAYSEFDKIKKFTNTISNLFLIGRNGTHKYNNMDHSMLSAMTAVECAISGDNDKEKIWQINTETEYHEEKKSENKVKIFLKKYWPEITALTIFTSISILWLFVHEPWFDEAQAYLIARDAGSLKEMIRIMGYEGSPMLWHLLILSLIKCGGGYLGMHVMHTILAIFIASLLLFWSPFPRLYKILMIFGYYFLYEYNAIARSYVLTVLFMFLIAMFYEKRNKHPLLFTLFLILLSQSNIHGTIIAGVIFLFWLWEIGKNIIEKKILKNNLSFLIPLLLLTISFVTVLIQIKPPLDLSMDMPFLKTTSPVQPIIATFNAFVPIPKINITFWNSNILLDYWVDNSLTHPYYWFIYVFVLLFFGYFFLLLSGYSLLKNKKAILMYCGLLLGLSLIYLILHKGFTRHFGLIWICYIFCLWIFYKTISFNRATKMFLTTILVAQIIASLIAGYFEITTNFSATKEISNYIKKQNIKQSTIISFPTDASIAAYFLPSSTKHLGYQQDHSYTTLNKQTWKMITNGNILINEMEKEIKKNSNIYFFTSTKLDYAFTKYWEIDPVSLENYRLIKYFGPSIVEMESFYLYQIK